MLSIFSFGQISPVSRDGKIIPHLHRDSSDEFRTSD